MATTTEQVIRIYDPAFESIHYSKLVPYMRSRDLEDLPELPPGADPVRFHFRRLTRSQVSWCQQGDNDAEIHRRAFLAGVVKITGGRFGDGWEPSNAHEPKRIAGDPLEFEEQRIAPQDEQEIGQWIWRRSVVPFDCAVLSLELRTSLAAYDGNAARYAARIQRAAAQSSALPKDP